MYHKMKTWAHLKAPDIVALSPRLNKNLKVITVHDLRVFSDYGINPV